MPELRLTGNECQDIADRTMQSLAGLDAAEALRRFRAGENDKGEVSTDEVTGKPFRRSISVRSVGDEGVLLWVAISAEPYIVRRARRFKFIAGLIEGRRNAPAGVAFKWLPVAASASKPK